MNTSETVAVFDHDRFPWAEQLSPRLLKSPWWIGHIPFAYEVIGRQRPNTIVELGTYSGSSFAAFCQAVEAFGLDAKCYGVDLWQGDIHMGRFEEDLFLEISAYMAATYPSIASLVRKDFSEAAALFPDKSVDLLHIDGTHTFEAVSNDFHTWLPKLSDRAIVLFHDVNVTVKNTGEAALRFGVRKFFDSVKEQYPHFEFSHCWGLGVLIVGRSAPPAVMELVEMARSPEFSAYFAEKGALVSRRFENMGVVLPVHGAYSPAASLWHRAVNKLHRIMRRLHRIVRSA
jgi:predicted O-methyltransferase YrrM